MTTGFAWYRRPAMTELRTWEIFADALLNRAVARRRTTWGRELDPLAGSVVNDSDLDRLLGELPVSRTASISQDGPPNPTDRSSAVDHAVDVARKALHTREPGDPFTDVVEAAGLDEISVEVLALLAAVGWDPIRLRLVGYVQDDFSVRGVMIASLPMLIDRDHHVIEALAPDAPLVRSCLVEIAPGAMPGSLAVTVPISVQWFLLGDQSRDAELPLDASEYSGDPLRGSPRLTLVHGLDRIRRLQAAAHMVGTSRLVGSPLPTSDVQWAALVRTAVCRRAAVALEIDEMTAEVRRWVEWASTVSWIISTRFPMNLEDLPSVAFVEAEVEDDPLDDDEVHRVLGEVPAGHRLKPNQLYQLSRHGSIVAADAIRRLASGELDKLSRRIRPRRSWDELVLSPDKLAQVREVLVRVRHRALVFDEWGFRAVPSAGVLALFAGPSGTGKTMSAEIIAGELGLDMFKIDLSALVSKYIGETEKNLERVFTAAEGGGVVLVFDEADAVFGKRTKVSDAQDRYANIETSYLLQRLESYDGLVVLTSNLSGNIDPAFMRRIHVSVEFPLPEQEERLVIWKSSFPATAPLGEIDFEFLANRFRFAGGSIRTAALTGAFAAADAGQPVTMAHVIQGVRREFQKLGRIITPAEFGEWYESDQPG